MQGAFAFGVAELAFDRDAVGFVLPLPFFLFAGELSRAAEGLSAQADPPLFAPGAIGAGLVDLVGVDAGGVVAEALAEIFGLHAQVGGFVVGIP